MMRGINSLLASVASVAAFSTAAQAACEWQPDRAVTVVIPWAAGGGTDAHARTLATLLEARFDVPFNAENRTGGNGVVGHTAIASAPADGYTIGAATIEITTMHHLGLTDLDQTGITPIALIDQSPAGVFVKAGSQFETLDQLLEHARANPGELTASGTSQGGIWHLALAGMLQANGLPADAIRWVPSEGAAPALQELIAAGVDVATPALTEGKVLAEAGEIIPLAVMSDQALAGMPDVPTATDAGGAEWALSSLITISGPVGLPEEIACSYEAAIADILASPEWAEFKTQRGAEVVSMSSENLTAMLDSTSQSLGAAIEAIGLAQ